jgi:YkoY family integral membrane protein
MDILHYLLGDNLMAAFFIIFNLFLIESLLSIDNAAVLATMVMDLPQEKRDSALKWGIFGAYLFRVLALIFASILIKIWWLKVLGGLYLLYLSIHYFISKVNKTVSDNSLNKKENYLWKKTVGLLGTFWTTVTMIQIMDLAFSIDNVFAAVAFTDNLFLICLGVFIGILSLRFVAKIFLNLMQKYPLLERSAFLVIGILGLKLTSSLYTHYFDNDFSKVLESEKFDLIISLITVFVFLAPIFKSKISK